MSFALPDLTYDPGELSPYISRDIMVLHHDKHHQVYVDKLNAALAAAHIETDDIGALLGALDTTPESVRQAIRNHGGGHYNHSLFWQWMSPQGGGEPAGALAELIAQRYGSYQAFVDAFTTKALGVFGSGWVWLLPDADILTTSNQDTPVMFGKQAPLLGLDVWEHAYYLDYKNNREDYIKAWWSVVNWDFVAEQHGRS